MTGQHPGPVALVTGGSRGIGAATARQLAGRGFAVCVNYAARADEANAVAAGIVASGGQATAVQADVSQPQQVSALFQACDGLGPLAVLVNNAGITGRSNTLAECDPDTIRRVIDINASGVLFCCREAVRRMSTRYGGSGGVIVNVSSAASTLGSAGEFVWYAASKGAVDTCTVGLAKEVGPEGIRVNAVNPGLIDTEIHAQAGDAERMQRLSPQVPLQRVGSADEVASAIVWLTSDEAAYCSGSVIRVAGGR